MPRTLWSRYPAVEGEYVVSRWHEPAIGSPVAAGFVRRVLEQAACDHFVAHELRELLDELGVGTERSGTCGGYNGALALADAAAQACEQGLLTVSLLPRQVFVAPQLTVPDGPEAPEAPRTEDLHWIEIELLTRNGDPVKNERFELLAENGRRRSGRTNEHGIARLEGLELESYEIHWPDLASEAWSQA